VSKHFNKYRIEKGNIIAETLFAPSDKLPRIPISTPFTFPIIDNKVVLAKDKMGWWNPLGGHINSGENWKYTIKREAYEEAGIEVGNIKLFGCIIVTKLVDHPDNKYPPISQIPMTVSRVLSIEKRWYPRETFERKIVFFNSAQKMLKLRTDNKQMLQIFQYLIKNLNALY